MLAKINKETALRIEKCQILCVNLDQSINRFRILFIYHTSQMTPFNLSFSCHNCVPVLSQSQGSFHHAQARNSYNHCYSMAGYFFKQVTSAKTTYHFLNLKTLFADTNWLITNFSNSLSKSREFGTARKNVQANKRARSSLHLAQKYFTSPHKEVLDYNIAQNITGMKVNNARLKINDDQKRHTLPNWWIINWHNLTLTSLSFFIVWTFTK